MNECPNCGDEAPLYISEEGVMHCGCFYEGDPDHVNFHITSFFPEHRSDWDAELPSEDGGDRG